jgi:hypothetical protein
MVSPLLWRLVACFGVVPPPDAVVVDVVLLFVVGLKKKKKITLKMKTNGDDKVLEKTFDKRIIQHSRTLIPWDGLQSIITPVKAIEMIRVVEWCHRWLQ